MGCQSAFQSGLPARQQHGSLWSQSHSCVSSCSADVLAQTAGSNSRYHPYIMTLPETPPCGFLMETPQLTEQLQRVMEDAEVDRALQAVRTAGDMYTTVRLFTLALSCVALQQYLDNPWLRSHFVVVRESMLARPVDQVCWSTAHLTLLVTSVRCGNTRDRTKAQWLAAQQSTCGDAGPVAARSAAACMLVLGPFFPGGGSRQHPTRRPRSTLMMLLTSWFLCSLVASMRP